MGVQTSPCALLTKQVAWPGLRPPEVWVTLQGRMSRGGETTECQESQTKAVSALLGTLLSRRAPLGPGH